ncbi:MAG TPA: hypothetical protein VHB99_19695, partial [Pirellulales bacterium]|nr:hypothetical protein [Pirellulales bacterium]
IVDEIHLMRRRIAEKFGGDIAAILDDARKRQEASGRTVWRDAAAAKTSMPARPLPCEPGGDIQE